MNYQYGDTEILQRHSNCGQLKAGRFGSSHIMDLSLEILHTSKACAIRPLEI